VPWISWPDIAVSPEGPFSISTFALSLLLVFRTNSSYDRWWALGLTWGAAVGVMGGGGGGDGLRVELAVQTVSSSRRLIIHS